MIVGDGADRLEILLSEVGKTDHDKGDLRLRIVLTSRRFSGTNEQVWIQADDFARFLGDLQALERDRQGEAKVSSMSPGDFDLRVRVRDGAGHVSAEGFLGTASYGDTGAAVKAKVGFSIDVDPTALPGILDALTHLPTG